LALLGLAGCPGRLEDPERFFGGDGGLCGDVAATLFSPRCGATSCHGGDSPAAGLDLSSPGLAARLAVGRSSCGSAPLRTYVLEKVQPGPTCGSRMPLGGVALTASELNCIQSFLSDLDGGP
jgi:hypothetical protein